MPKPDEIEPMVTAGTIARLLGVSGRWVRKHAEESRGRPGDFPAYRVGSTWRFRVSEVLAWVEQASPGAMRDDDDAS